MTDCSPVPSAKNQKPNPTWRGSKTAGAHTRAIKRTPRRHRVQGTRGLGGVLGAQREFSSPCPTSLPSAWRLRTSSAPTPSSPRATVRTLIFSLRPSPRIRLRGPVPAVGEALGRGLACPAPSLQNSLLGEQDSLSPFRSSPRLAPGPETTDPGGRRACARVCM